MAGTTTITDDGAAIKITTGALVRDIIKTQIREVSVIKTTIVKIDIGGGALRNVFFDYTDISSPATANANLLRAAIMAMLAPAAGSGGSAGSATEAKQNEQIGLLGDISNVSYDVLNYLQNIDNKVFYQPLLVDDGGIGIIYKGYALPGTSMEMPRWAIERVKKEGDLEVHTWVNGNRNFNNSWLDRERLTYL